MLEPRDVGVALDSCGGDAGFEDDRDFGSDVLCVCQLGGTAAGFVLARGDGECLGDGSVACSIGRGALGIQLDLPLDFGEAEIVVGARKVDTLSLALVPIAGALLEV